jgi:hypothetical protein
MCRRLIPLIFSVVPVLGLVSNTFADLTNDPSLVLYYTFDQVGAIVADQSGKGHDGVVHGDVTAFAEGKCNGAAQFKGIGGPAGQSYLDLNGPSIPADDIPTTAITLAAWVKCQNTGGHHAIFNARASDATWVIHPELRSNGVFRWLLRAAGSVVIFDMSAGSVTWDQWLHYAGTYDKATGKAILYINGQVVGEQNVANPQNIAGNWGSGARVGYNIDNARPFTGLMDELYLFKRALTADEIKQIMEKKPTPPQMADRPNPANGAKDMVRTPTLGWSPGGNAASHNIYLADNFEDVNNRSAFKANQTATSYGPATLTLGKTYYWCIDEVAADATVSKGTVWSFTVAGYILIDDFEDYNDLSPDRIFDTWMDGWQDPTNGSVVGHAEPPFAERSIVHGGYQAMPFLYDNSGQANYSQALADIDDLKCGRDWTAQAVKALSLWFRGYPAYFGSFVEGPTGTYTMTAGGADIWGGFDQFHFAFKEVSGASTVVAKVLSVSNTDSSARAGVMIRDTLDPNSAHVMVCVTPGSGVVMQYRNTAGAAAGTASQQAGIVAPQWVKIERTLGGLIRGYYSADGVNWTLLATVATVTMDIPMYVGLGVTSHNVNQKCTAQFSDVSFPSTTVGAQWTDRDIGITSNEAEPMYVAISNSNGKTGIVYHEDPNATLINTWTEWNIDLKEFSSQGVVLSDVDKMAIGFGDKAHPQPGGTGTMYFDDVRLYPPRCILDKVTGLEGDLTDDCVVDAADLEIMANDWLQGDHTRPSELLVYWAFDGGSGTIAADGSGKGHDGVISGATWRSPGYGGTGYCLSFNGLGNEVNDVDAGGYLNGLDAVTFSVWIKSNVTNTDRGFLICTDPDGTDNRDMRYDEAGSMSGSDDVIKCGITSTEGLYEIESAGTVQTTDWQHLAMAWKSGEPLKLYINGVLDSSFANQPIRGGVLTGYTKLLVGRGGKDTAANQGWDGLVDEVRIYDYALSQAEVKTVTNRGTLPKVDVYYPLQSPAELYAAEPVNSRRINFRDFAILADQWLVQLLWP